MTQPLLWLLLSGPAALVAAALLPIPPGRAGALVRADRAQFAALAALVTAVLAVPALALGGPQGTGTLGPAGIGLAVTLDALSAIGFLLVSFIGTVVIRFSRNYLDGDPGHAAFIRRLALTLAAVLVLILSGNLAQMLVAWVACSLTLHRLLLFYADRPNAVLAARKKLVASRLGDVCLIGAAAFVWSLFGSLDLAAVKAGAATLATGPVPLAVHAAAALLVGAAVLKSAQFPVHGWLLEVMETPTPVSALLHAGVINAGGFLLLRWADMLALSVPAQDALMILGGLTALVGSVVMLTQTSVKVALAWSTIAQMGFMMLQVGLGAYSAALLHIVAHSLYKAHAFLSSGSVVDLARAAWSPSPGGPAHPARLTLAVVLVLSAGLAAASLFGTTVTEQPGAFALAAIVMLGLVHLLVNALDAKPIPALIGRAVAMSVAVAAGYAALQWAAAAVTEGSLPHAQPLRGVFDLALVVLVLAGFAAITILQSVMPAHAGEPRWQALYAHVSNGFYVNTLANRLAIRLWPAPAPKPLLTSAPKGR